MLTLPFAPLIFLEQTPEWASRVLENVWIVENPVVGVGCGLLSTRLCSRPHSGVLFLFRSALIWGLSTLLGVRIVPAGFFREMYFCYFFPALLRSD